MKFMAFKVKDWGPRAGPVWPFSENVLNLRNVSSLFPPPGVGGEGGDGMHGYDVFYLNCEVQDSVVRDSGPWVEQILQQSKNV